MAFCQMRVRKLPVIGMFLLGVIAVFTLILTRNFFRTNIANGEIAQNLIIYNGQLSPEFSNWSWNSTVNFSTTNSVYQGSDTISYTPTSAYGGLYLHTDAGIATAPYQNLTFAAQASGNGQIYAVGAYDTNNQLLHTVSLNSYGGQPVQGSWKVYTIPLQDLNAAGKTIKGIMIQDASGTTQNTLFIGQVALTGQVSTREEPTDIPASPTIPAAQHSSGNPLAGLQFFNDPDTNPAFTQQEQWQTSSPADAAEIAKIADQPKALWMGDWSGNIQSAIQSEMNKAQTVNELPVFVAYNIPERDCGGYSSGGATSPQAYQTWIDGFAAGIGNRRAAVILEPDALAQLTCLSAADQQSRYNLLFYAVQKFKSLGQTAIYIDAGNSSWIDAPDMATRLEQSDIKQADGFALNVSNFVSDSDSIAYGRQISELVGGKHFVIDTSRNGNGPAPDNAWCNPDGRALGNKPTTQTGNSLVDAYLWIKYPGESDGTCNGGPSAGVWYPSYALGLAQQAQW